MKGLLSCHQREVDKLVAEEHWDRTLVVALGACHIVHRVEDIGCSRRTGFGNSDRILLVVVCSGATIHH